MQRHRRNHVVLAVDRQRTVQEFRKRSCQRAVTREFIEMDQPAEAAFIRAIAEGLLKTAGAQAASPAKSVFIQREVIDERSLALPAEKLGLQRLRRRQALRADGDPADTL
jgi:hypothetical protein